MVFIDMEFRGPYIVIMCMPSSYEVLFKSKRLVGSNENRVIIFSIEKMASCYSTLESRKFADPSNGPQNRGAYTSFFFPRIPLQSVVIALTEI